MALLGQFVSLMSAFFTNSSVIERGSYQHDFYEKVNMTMGFSFVAASLVTFGVALSVIESRPPQKQSAKSKHDEQRLWLMSCLCNSLMPGFAIAGRAYLFNCFNFCIAVFGMYSAFKASAFKLNGILLSMELMAFHIGFMILSLFDS